MLLLIFQDTRFSFLFYHCRAFVLLLTIVIITICNSQDLIFQAVLQITEDIVNSQLELINQYIFRIFPNQSSLFIRTTPKQYFFDGIPFCLSGDEVTVFICRVVEDIVKRNIQYMTKLN